MKRSLLALLSLAGLGAAIGVFATSAEVSAQSQGACCAQATSKLDALLNPVKGGDEKFFTGRSSGAPNVALAIDNSGSMLNWPFELCQGGTYENDCTCEKLNNIGYNPAVTYEPEIKNFNSTTFHTDWFRTATVYEVLPRRDDFGKPMVDIDTYGLKDPGGGSTVPAGNRFASNAAACVGATNPGRCESCLRDNGYYFDTDNEKDRMTGNFLNYFSPKYLMARRTLKQVMRDIRPIRMSLMTFGERSGGSVGDDPESNDTDLSKWSGPPVQLTDFNPACNLSDPSTNRSSFDSNRQSIATQVDGIRFAFPYTPMARSLLLGGYSLLRYDSNLYTNNLTPADGGTWHGNLGWASSVPSSFLEGTGDNQKSICDSCVFSAILYITDGAPNDSLYEGRVPVPGDDIEVEDCPLCTASKMDEVARFLWNNDFRPDHSGRQKVATFTVAFGLPAGSEARKLLRSAAAKGGGEFYSAQTGQQLKQALMNAFDNILTRNTAFSSANIASLQTSDVTLTAIIPRLRPSKESSWSGLLYRFNQYNEFIVDAEHPQDNDPDGGVGYKSDIFLVDENNDIVVEEPDTGAFVKKVNTNVPAAAAWEASEIMIRRGHRARTILTVIDNNDDGRFAAGDTQVAFDTANAQTLLPYLGLAEPGLCPNVATAELGRIFTKLAPTQPELENICGNDPDAGVFTLDQPSAQLCCAKVMIEWVRGRNLGSSRADGGSTTRDDVLGDIFHSSPVTVDPPTSRFLCDLGISNQCVRTLYSKQLGDTAFTPLAPASTTVTTPECGEVPNADAYDEFIATNYRRDKVVLVGANDGMLHAFQSGASANSADGGYVCTTGFPNVPYNNGDVAGRVGGQELWAFIPPDQLSRIHERIFGHTYYVDGDIMVRDIWADSAAAPDGQKQASEFHTVAVAAEGRGGNHYFALNMRFDANGRMLLPEFRWMFPQPCTPEASHFGKTLYSLSPKPPPIGPVLLGGSVSVTGTPTLTNGADTNTVVRYGENTTERWMVMLSGGWAPFLDKGRGLYMVDAWSPQVNGREDNLWWKAEFDPSASGADAPKQHMTHSFAAPVALIDYGLDRNPRLDGFFDMALAGDTRGQLWLTRMSQPGRLDATSGLIGNWPIARAFEMDKGNTSLYATSALNDFASVTAKQTSHVWPFFYLPSSALQPENGALRAFIGSGNRYALLDDGPGVCRFDNPAACSKYQGCDTVREVGFNNRMSTNLTRVENHWANSAGTPLYAHASQSTGASAGLSACGTGGVVASAGFTEREIVCTGTYAPTNSPPTQLGNLHVECAKNGVDGGFFCGLVDGGIPYTDDYKIPDAGIAPNLGNNRFYGIRVYGVDRLLTPDGDGGLTPEQFDDGRFTDRGGDAGVALVDVTSVSCSRTGCTGGAPTSGPGWFYEYSHINKKTSSGSVVLAGCALWSDIYPSSGSDGGCGSAINAKSELVQADYITGQPNCAFGFLNADGGYSRLKTRDVIAPPPEPSMAIMIGPNQQIKYSAMIVEPGQQQATEVTISAGSDILQAVYELPVSRQLHKCRHTDGGCNDSP